MPLCLCPRQVVEAIQGFNRNLREHILSGLSVMLNTFNRYAQQFRVAATMDAPNVRVEIQNRPGPEQGYMNCMTSIISGHLCLSLNSMRGVIMHLPATKSQYFARKNQALRKMQTLATSWSEDGTIPLIL